MSSACPRCAFAQGAKTVIVGHEVYEYDASRMMVFSVALPVATQVTRASHSEPYLALKLDLDPHKIAELVLKVIRRACLRHKRERRLRDSGDESILSAATRLMRCLGQP